MLASNEEKMSVSIVEWLKTSFYHFHKRWTLQVMGDWDTEFLGEEVHHKKDIIKAIINQKVSERISQWSGANWGM